MFTKFDENSSLHQVNLESFFSPLPNIIKYTGNCSTDNDKHTLNAAKKDWLGTLGLGEHGIVCSLRFVLWFEYLELVTGVFYTMKSTIRLISE